MAKKPMREPYPSETKDRFMVRLPDGMRNRIAKASEEAGRTMNAEIVARLEASFGLGETVEVQLKRLARRVTALEKMVHSGVIPPTVDDDDPD